MLRRIVTVLVLMGAVSVGVVGPGYASCTSANCDVKCSDPDKC